MEEHPHGRSHVVRVKRPEESLSYQDTISTQAAHNDERGWHVDTVGPLGHYRMSCDEAKQLAHAYWAASNECAELRASGSEQDDGVSS